MKKVLLLAALLGFASSASAQLVTNLILNGSFENGTNPGTFTTVDAVNNTSITDWAVTGGSVDYIGSYWQASDGERSIDLAGLGLGVLQQAFSTIVGQDYRVTFDLAGNYDQPGIKTVGVSAGGPVTTFDFNSTGHSSASMGWVTRTFAFTAVTTSSTLSFSAVSGGEPPYWGPALDNVSVTLIPEPSTYAAIIGLGAFGLVAVRRWRRRGTASPS